MCVLSPLLFKQSWILKSINLMNKADTKNATSPGLVAAKTSLQILLMFLARGAAGLQSRHDLTARWTLVPLGAYSSRLPLAGFLAVSRLRVTASRILGLFVARTPRWSHVGRSSALSSASRGRMSRVVIELERTSAGPSRGGRHGHPESQLRGY